MAPPHCRTLVLKLLLTCLMWSFTSARGLAEDASGLELVGMDPLQGRSSYQIVPHQQNGRWLLYVGHHPGRGLNPLTGVVEENGMSVVDVTDPQRPKYLHHQPPSDVPWIKGSAPASGSYHFSICDGADLPRGKKGKVYVLRTVGDFAHEIVDVTNPTKWRVVTQVVRSEPSDLDKAYHTHNSAWDCSSGLAIMVVSKASWHAAQIYQAFDLSDPENPKHIRDFNLPGSEPGSSSPAGRVIPGGTWANMAHGVRIIDGRIYLSYNPFWAGTVQILDLKKFLSGDSSAKDPLKPTAESLIYPQIGRFDFPGYWGVHTAEPIIGMRIPEYDRDKQGQVRDILFTLSEGTIPQCSLPRAVLFVMDISDPAFPVPISTYQADSEKGRYCERFTYFGPHNIQPLTNPMFRGKLLFVTYFSGGLRVIDIRDPFKPVEVGHFIPNATQNTRYTEQKGPLQGRDLEKAPLTNDVGIDARGYIYISDRASTGMHILKLTEKPMEIMDRKD